MADTHHEAQGTRGQDVSWSAANRDSRNVYSNFLSIAKWATILVVLVLIAMAIFLA